MDFPLIAWNMARRQAGWSYLMDRLDPHVALLQEAVPPAVARPGSTFIHGRAYAEHAWGSAVYVKDRPARQIPIAAHAGWVSVAEIELPDHRPAVLASVHARIVQGYVRPNLDDVFERLAPLLEGRTFIVGGDLNVSRLYDRAQGTTHHTEFLDDLETRGLVNCHRRFHAEEEQTFWGSGVKHPYQNDHLFVSKDLEERLTRCDVVDRTDVEELSDHSPLLAVLEY